MSSVYGQNRINDVTGLLKNRRNDVIGIWKTIYNIKRLYVSITHNMHETGIKGNQLKFIYTISKTMHFLSTIKSKLCIWNYKES